MNQAERQDYLIRELLREQPRYQNQRIPPDSEGKKTLLRSLFNVRPPMRASDMFIKIQDAYLQEEIKSKGICGIEELSPIRSSLYLWQGDITTLGVEAIVNAANSQMLGCFVPCHGCIDNVIHTFAGIQLRLACYEIMQKQGKPEKTGAAKITPAFNLPSKYVLHTVGPIITGRLTQNDCDLLASCYNSCMELAEEKNISSIAFCCISTGVFCFPNDMAAETAIQAVEKFIAERQSKVKVIFNVFKETDYDIYKKLLESN